MKKTILTLTASLLFSAAAVFAQDTTRTDQQQDRYRTEGMVEVQAADLPEAITTTLEDSKYQGWEEGTIYLDPETGEYIVEIEKSGEESQQYRFDRSGTEITDSEGNQQDQENRDPMNQETDTTQQQQDQNQYNQQQNDQQNQDDDAMQTDTTQQDLNQNQDQQYRTETETDTTQQNQENQNAQTQDDQNVQNQDNQYRTEESDTTQLNQEGQINQEGQNQNQEGQLREDSENQTEMTQDTAQNEQGQDQAVSENQEGDETDAANETAYRTDEAEGKTGDMKGHYRVIEATELPSAVVTALEEGTYDGWRDHAVYVDTKTNDYIVQSNPKSGESEGKYYRLDKSGKDISKHKKDKS